MELPDRTEGCPGRQQRQHERNKDLIGALRYQGGNLESAQSCREEAYRGMVPVQRRTPVVRGSASIKRLTVSL
jgi:hypothetical protein